MSHRADLTLLQTAKNKTSRSHWSQIFKPQFSSEVRNRCNNVPCTTPGLKAGTQETVKETLHVTLSESCITPKEAVDVSFDWSVKAFILQDITPQLPQNQYQYLSFSISQCKQMTRFLHVFTLHYNAAWVLSGATVNGTFSLLNRQFNKWSTQTQREMQSRSSVSVASPLHYILYTKYVTWGVSV